MFSNLFGRPQPQPSAEVSPEAAAALVRADETVRRGTDELGFATAEFGEASTREFAQALTAATQHLREAFRLNALLLDDQPETPQQREQIQTGVLGAAGEVERLIRGPASTFAARRAALREAPAAIARLRGEATDVASRVAEARSAVKVLTTRYQAEAIMAVASNPDQAQELLGFSDRSLSLAQRRHESGRGDDATKAIQVASDSIRRAADLIDAVTDYEVEAVEAESTLAAVLADSRADVTEARALLAASPDAEIETAATALQESVTAAASEANFADPFTTLSALRAANSRLDRAVQERRSAPDRQRLRAQVEAALADGDRQVALARALISDHPGLVGPEARTRLAQAQRLMDELATITDPTQALSQIRHAADLAADAAALAERDVANARQSEQGWGMKGRGAPLGGGMGQVLGGVLGGMVLGGILDDFDLDFD